MEPIASVHNPRIRQLVALRDRRERARTGRILVDGAREIRRALESETVVEQLVACAALCAGEECRSALALATSRGIPRLDVTDRVFEKLAYGDRADGLVAVARPPSTELARLRLPPEPLVVVVVSVEKPGNLGAILRSADGAGADALIVADPATDLFNANAIRASLGTIFSVPLAAASTSDVVAWLTAHRLRVVTARVDAQALYTDADLRGGIGLVLGSEAEGLTAAWDGPGFEPVRLPMLGVADSLNVSVTAAVLLYEARRQRGAPNREAADGGVPTRGVPNRGPAAGRAEIANDAYHSMTKRRGRSTKG
ncbi:MAG TPA: TrmH family RNA methyltransferase [Candidatus Saccharimonadales bacterium]|nr:TrmH family RNA methyltransferase [Candidatus Saccharimonadales bacterium]